MNQLSLVECGHFIHFVLARWNGTGTYSWEYFLSLPLYRSIYQPWKEYLHPILDYSRLRGQVVHSLANNLNGNRVGPNWPPADSQSWPLRVSHAYEPHFSTPPKPPPILPACLPSNAHTTPAANRCCHWKSFDRWIQVWRTSCMARGSTFICTIITQKMWQPCCYLLTVDTMDLACTPPHTRTLSSDQCAISNVA